MIQHLPKIVIFVTIGILAMPSNDERRDRIVNEIAASYLEAYRFCSDRVYLLATVQQFPPMVALRRTEQAVTKPDSDKPIDGLGDLPNDWLFERSATLEPRHWVAGTKG